MKKIAFVACLGAAALFTACGDDESSDFSCTYKEGKITFCEFGSEIDGAEEYCETTGGVVGSSCEEGETLYCEMGEGAVYIYGDLGENKIDCDLLQ